MTQTETLLVPFEFDAVIADRICDFDLLWKMLAAQQAELVNPCRRNRKLPRDYDECRYRERNIVDPFINIIK